MIIDHEHVNVWRCECLQHAFEIIPCLHDILQSTSAVPPHLPNRSCLREDGTEDPKKGTQLLDIYALEIQMYTEQRNNKKLKQVRDGHVEGCLTSHRRNHVYFLGESL